MMNESEQGVPMSRKTGTYDFSIGSILSPDQGSDNRSVKIQRVINHQTPALSVLIVDDSITQRKLASKTLGGQIDDILWMIDTAENGERAMQLCERSPRPPDVIIIDQNMESSGGRLLGSEVVAHLRQNVFFRSVVIIGCTGFFESAESRFIDAGCDAVWSKPIPSKEIAQSQIHNFLQLKKTLLQQQWYSRQNLTNEIKFTTPAAYNSEFKTHIIMPASFSSTFGANISDLNNSFPVFEQIPTKYFNRKHQIEYIDDYNDINDRKNYIDNKDVNSSDNYQTNETMDFSKLQKAVEEI